MIVTKEDLIRSNDVYWDVCSKALELLKVEFPEYDYIGVDEIHVDSEDGYVFVSYSYRKTKGSWTYQEASKTYRINKFLSLINEDEV